MFKLQINDHAARAAEPDKEFLRWVLALYRKDLAHIGKTGRPIEHCKYNKGGAIGRLNTASRDGYCLTHYPYSAADRQKRLERREAQQAQYIGERLGLFCRDANIDFVQDFTSWHTRAVQCRGRYDLSPILQREIIL
jgi:hypothetical protein